MSQFLGMTEVMGCVNTWGEANIDCLKEWRIVMFYRFSRMPLYCLFSFLFFFFNTGLVKILTRFVLKLNCRFLLTL